MKKNKPTNLIKDYKKIIEIQERIIKATESERKQVHDLFMHYLDKSIEGWDWYARYRLYYDAIVLVIKDFSNAKLVYELKKSITKGDMTFWNGGSDE